MILPGISGSALLLIAGVYLPAMHALRQLLRLDFSEVPFMDSSGIGLILGRIRLMALWGGRVAVAGLSPQLRKMAELSGIAALAALENTEMEVHAK